MATLPPFDDILQRVLEASYPKSIPASVIGMLAEGFRSNEAAPRGGGLIRLARSVLHAGNPEPALAARGIPIGDALVRQGRAERVEERGRVLYRFVVTEPEHGCSPGP